VPVLAYGLRVRRLTRLERVKSLLFPRSFRPSCLFWDMTAAQLRFANSNNERQDLLLMADNTSTFMELTASIVSAYVRHNSVPSAELPALIERVHTALMRVSSGHGEALGDVLRTPVKNQSLRITSSALRTDRDSSHSSDICAPITTSHQSSIARSGVLAAIIPW